MFQCDWQLVFHWKIIWFRSYPGGPGWVIKTPSCRKLFSERNGYTIPTLSLLGFRLFPLEPSKR